MTDTSIARPLADDVVQPFQIESSRLRGRMVRLGHELDDILTRHAYPATVARFLAETAALTALLASMLKYEGIFTLQTKGDGPIRLMVADVTSTGEVRAYAQFDEDAVALAAGRGDIDIAPAPALLGKGYIAFTVDQGGDTDRYQGIVDLYGKTLADCVQHYFRQSEQIDTGITVAVGHDDTGWHAGGIMVQRVPEEGGTPVLASDSEDDWRRAMVLLASTTSDELLDRSLSPHDLLFRLFNQDGVRVWAPQAMRFGCRCSRHKVETMLASLPRAEIEDLRVDGVVEVVCQFCSSAYRFDDAALAQVYGGNGGEGA